MGRKVFISYKYGDTSVPDLNKKALRIIDGRLINIFRQTRVRDYVDEIQGKIGRDNINLGEKDGESLKEFADSTIETTLKERIFRSSVTLVIISKGMKDLRPEVDQWIPWEISYSLRKVGRQDVSSQRNGILGVVLPDETGSYSWYYTENPNCKSISHHTDQLFGILRDNMFNILNKTFRECNGTYIYSSDEPSYIKTVKWVDFMYGNNCNSLIEQALKICQSADLYDLHINLD